MPPNVPPYGLLIEIAVEPKRTIDRDRLLHVLASIAASDSELTVTSDGESGQIILGGRDVDQLDRAALFLREHHRIAIEIGAPQVAYRETLTRRVETDHTYKMRTGTTGQFARVRIVFEPAPAGSAFESKIVGGAVPDDCISGVEAGIATVMRSGVLAGFPVVDVKATLMDGAYHGTDSSPLTFEIAARAAFREALAEGRSVLLEPIMRVEVTTPEDYIGFVVGDLRAKRGRVLSQAMRDNTAVIIATAPLANLFGYSNQLRSGSQERASYSMQFATYAPAPPPWNGDDDLPPAAAVALR